MVALARHILLFRVGRQLLICNQSSRLARRVVLLYNRRDGEASCMGIGLAVGETLRAISAIISAYEGDRADTPCSPGCLITTPARKG